MIKGSRFVRTYKQGIFDVIEILVDKKTGINYVYRTNGYAGGMSVLLDKDGKPVITPMEN